MIAYRDARPFYAHHPEVLIFPQAAPVQFWLTDCDTYNQTIPKGVHYKCFCLPWKCDDIIQIPFRDTFSESDIVESENIVAVSLADLDDWTSLAGTGDFAWTTGVSPTVNLPGIVFPDLVPSASEYLISDYDFEEDKEYTVTINYDFVVNSGSSNPRTTRVSILDDDNVVIFTNTTSTTTTGSYSISITFTATATTSKIGFKHTSGRNVDVTVTSTSATRTDIVITYPDPSNYEVVIYNENNNEIERVSVDALLIPEGLFYYHTALIDLSELEICEEQIRFEIEDLSASPDTVVAKSDCQNVTDSDSNPTLLVEYSSPKNFNGLVFEGISPDPTYNIRIPAIFFHEQYPQVDEVAQLTSQVIKLNSQTQAKKLMETDFIPYYMHLKIQLILAMPLLLIDGVYWTKQDGYEIDDGSKRWPVKRATCWLTQRDFLERQSI